MVDARNEVAQVAAADLVETEKDEDPLSKVAAWTPGETVDDDSTAASNPGSGPTRECQNCNNRVSAQYVKVNEPDGIEQPRCCPNCEDLIRDGNGVREKRT